MGFAKIQGKLTGRIGRPVNYGMPKDVADSGKGKPYKGEVKDEVWESLALNERPPHSSPCPDANCWGDYSFVSQLIEWTALDGEVAKREVRLGYWRRRCGENAWEYASQMTISGAPDRIERLLKKTLATNWFNSPDSN